MMLGWLVVVQLVCSWGLVAGSAVYLRELTIYTPHERKFFGFQDKPKVYLECQDDGNDSKLMLKSVNKVNVPYGFGEEEHWVTHVEVNDCRKCSIMEQDEFTKDDVFGEFTLCHKEFEITGRVPRSKEGEFDAVFECKGCVPLPPPDTKIVYVEAQASTETIRKSSIVDKTDRIWQSPWFVIMLVGMTLFGLIFGGVSYRYYLIVRERTEEERLKEFEAILGDPDVDFDEMVEQDQKAFNLNFWKHIQWHPKKWIKVDAEEKV